MPGRTFALIVAAGASRRMGGELSKPYVNLTGVPVLRRGIETFLSHPRIDGVRVVIKREDHPRYRRVTEGLTLFPSVMGGQTRQDSVRLGLESLVHRAPARVLIHDAARPLLTHALIDRVISALDSYPAVLPAVPVPDTLKRVEKERVTATLPRDGLFAAQTPQGFDFKAILAAHRHYTDTLFTDDIALAEAAGIAIGVVPGERDNLKLTTPEDFAFMQKIADKAYETRIGFGVDAHPFAPHDSGKPVARRSVALCGVKIPHDQRLQGHSDADAGLHALVDALLGTIGAGDIGRHFPPDDPQWAGADSARFLLHTYQLLKAKGGDIVNIDITVICEKPHIAPYREQMAARVASLLKLAPERVNVKATTTEKMGFLGRGEGLMAQAAVAVRLPLGA